MKEQEVKKVKRGFMHYVITFMIAIIVMGAYPAYIIVDAAVDDWYWGTRNGEMLHKIDVLTAEISRDKEVLKQTADGMVYRERVLQVAKCKVGYFAQRKDPLTECDHYLK